MRGWVCCFWQGLINNRDGDRGGGMGGKLGGERWPMNLIRGVRCSAAWRKIRVGYISGVVGAVGENYRISRILSCSCQFCGLLACSF